MLTYSKIVKPLARELRNNQTDAEVLLWSRIRRKQILGVQFNRQKPIDRYIVDFYSTSAKLVIELDGIQHYEIDAIEYDFERTKTLESFGLKSYFVLKVNHKEQIPPHPPFKKGGVNAGVGRCVAIQHTSMKI